MSYTRITSTTATIADDHKHGNSGNRIRRYRNHKLKNNAASITDLLLVLQHELQVTRYKKERGNLTAKARKNRPIK